MPGGKSVCVCADLCENSPAGVESLCELQVGYDPCAYTHTIMCESVSRVVCPFCVLFN